MKKTILSVATAALCAMALSVTACSESTFPLDNSSEIFESVSNNSEEDPVISEKDNSENKTENSSSSESTFSDDTPEIEITAPDGSILKGSEAVSVEGNLLKFDHSYIRYAQPIFYSTLDDPELFNWETREFTVEQSTSIKDPNYFKVKTGDRLENGLTVKSAEYEAFNYGRIDYSLIYFEGEITLEGILHCHSTDAYTVNRGQLDFWADPTKNDHVAVSCGSYFQTDQISMFRNTTDKLAIICDGDKIVMGNLDNAAVDLSGIIAPGECIRAKVTIKDLLKGWLESADSVSRVELVSVEVISD